MAADAVGIEAPTGSDAFDPQGDMVKLAISLHGMVIIPVPTAAARTTVCGVLDAAGVTSAYFQRADASAGRRLEFVPDTSTPETVNTIGSVGLSMPFAIATGTVSVSITASSTGSAPVTFPVGRFTQAPIVQLTASGDGFDATHSAITSAGCTVTLRHVDGSSATLSRTVHWTAIQMLSGAAAG